METPDLSPSTKVFQPTSEQLRRNEELRRFNRVYIYFPIAIVTILAFSIVLSLILYVILADSTEYLDTVSAIADVILVITIIAIMLMIVLFLAIAGAVYFQARKADIAPLRAIQVLFWRLDLFTVRIQRGVNDFVPKLANPFIRVRARFAFWRVLLNKLKNLFSRG